VDADDIKAGAIVETVVSAAMRAGVVSVRTILEQVEQWYSRENCNAAAA
jgi:dihydroorotate dehydrogenase